jgi:Rps23 Pro-64 3,4-dihydroxylase Tpa1-like proline 4-hydroxylase
MFELHKRLDPKALSEIYNAHGRLQIANFLSEASAAALHHELQRSAAWRLTLNRGEQILDFSMTEVERWSDHACSVLDRAVTLSGRTGFQFRYEVIRMIDPSTCPGLTALVAFLSSPEIIDLMKGITGAKDIAFADAHASRFQPGHFLTTHDDAAHAMGRRAAYVLNLTPTWRPDWGGLLQFYDSMGNVTRGFTPSFNVLTLFPVPRPHSVTWVNPLAPVPRVAVTGWLRSAQSAE